MHDCDSTTPTAPVAGNAPRDSAARVPYMKSQNFEFLRQEWPELADLGGFAELYVFTDPESSVTKQRKFLETLVDFLYEVSRTRVLFGSSLIDRLTAEAFTSWVPQVIVDKCHIVRTMGNQGVHGGRKRPITPAMAASCLQELFDIARWAHPVCGHQRPVANFVAPTNASGATAKQPKVDAVSLERARLADIKLTEALDQLKQEREDRQKAEAQADATAAQLAALQAEHATRIAEMSARSAKSVSSLHFDEATTRSKLINQALIAAGWNVGVNGASTDAVGQEVKVTGMPNKTGEGFVDYVLYDQSGRPLAVVEAKRTAKSVDEGEKQAKLYADCLQNATGHRPLIFLANGFQIKFVDELNDYPRRDLYGFYSPDSLAYRIHQAANKKALAHVPPTLNIADRMYQLEAIKRVAERFTDKHRRALVVQATGTGKTRVAISICDVMLRAGWAKRILFLCDRRELRKQADKTFKAFIPHEPRIILDSSTAGDRNARIYLATYNSMANCLEDFDVGFFDLIIADEVHRSVYNKYRSIFTYLDALQIGLTATPVNLIDRDTFGLFGCDGNNPTSNFDYQQAIEANPPYLVPFRVWRVQSDFRRAGVRFADMNDAQKAQAEDQLQDAEDLDYTAADLDRRLFNADTTSKNWQSLMANGIKDTSGNMLGKTIVFARSHNHAVHLRDVFERDYPQYGNNFCQIIDNTVNYAESLIDDFKDNDSSKARPLTIAISVDMLDTGIDVPEVVNLVFAKPVKSFVKFWQMIGRGTRLCKNLFGPGNHKTEFIIIDHFDNFDHFGTEFQEPSGKLTKPLLQKLFETRVELAQACLDKMDEAGFNAAAALLLSDIKATIATNAIDTRGPVQADLQRLADGDHLASFTPAVKHDLLRIVAPLQKCRTTTVHDESNEAAYRFDLLTTRTQLEIARGGASAQAVQDLRPRIEECAELLPKNQNQIKAKAESIKLVQSRSFWENVTVADIEGIRTDLRGVMRHQVAPRAGRPAPLYIDITDTNVSVEAHIPNLEGLELVEYRQRVRGVIDGFLASDPVIARIRTGKSVTEQDLENLAGRVLAVDDRANVKHLAGRDPQTRSSLLDVFRGLVGRDAEQVQQAFEAFSRKYTHKLTSQQLHFLQILQKFIADHGGIEIERLYEAPFTNLHAESIDGVFKDESIINELLAIVRDLEPRKAPDTDPPPIRSVS